MSRHSSDLRMCNCRMCRYGRHRGWGNFIVKYTRRKYRHMVKRMLKNGEYDVPNRQSVPYTD